MHEIWQQTLGRVSAYRLPLDKFASLLDVPLSRVFQVVIDGYVQGFAITYLIRSGAASNAANQHLKGSLASLAVHPAYQGQGIGTALHDAALQYLEKEVRRSLTLSVPAASKSELQLGSIFPRIFPGLPEGEEFDHAGQWFTKRGWKFSSDISIDLYQPISSEYRISKTITDKPYSLGIRFGSPQKNDDEGLFLLQNSTFGIFTVRYIKMQTHSHAGMARHVSCFNRGGKTRRHMVRF